MGLRLRLVSLDNRNLDIQSVCIGTGIVEFHELRADWSSGIIAVNWVPAFVIGARQQGSTGFRMMMMMVMIMMVTTISDNDHHEPAKVCWG